MTVLHSGMIPVTTRNHIQFVQTLIPTMRGGLYGRNIISGGAGRNRTLGLTALGNIRVPVPDYNKQVVFTRLWEKVETTRRLQAELASDLASYVPSLLAKAFRGEL